MSVTATRKIYAAIGKNRESTTRWFIISINTIYSQYRKLTLRRIDTAFPFKNNFYQYAFFIMLLTYYQTSRWQHLLWFLDYSFQYINFQEECTKLKLIGQKYIFLFKIKMWKKHIFFKIDHRLIYFNIKNNRVVSVMRNSIFYYLNITQNYENVILWLKFIYILQEQSALALV